MTSKAVLITGCSSGIGRATALRLARSDWTVYAAARRLESIADLHDAGCKTLVLDVTDAASIEQAVAQVESESGAVDALVNNAGYSQSGAIEEVPVDQIRRQFETNIFGLAALTQRVLPAMRAQGWGRIVNLGSMGGTLTFPGGGYYHATKYALEAFSDALRFEVENFGIDVVLIQPGLIRTGFDKAAVDSMPPAAGDAGPYARFNKEVARITQSAYRNGLMAKLAGEPDNVAQIIERALSADKPKARYPVTWSARLLMWQRRLLPDRLWDAFLGRNYPRPGP